MEALTEKSKLDAAFDIYSEAQNWAGDAYDKSKELYRRVERNLPEGTVSAVGLASAALAVGMVGYRLGKVRERRRAVPEMAKSVEEKIETLATPIGNFDFTPIYKLVKLWMLYRIAS